MTKDISQIADPMDSCYGNLYPDAPYGDYTIRVFKDMDQALMAETIGAIVAAIHMDRWVEQNPNKDISETDVPWEAVDMASRIRGILDKEWDEEGGDCTGLMKSIMNSRKIMVREGEMSKQDYTVEIWLHHKQIFHNEYPPEAYNWASLEDFKEEWMEVNSNFLHELAGDNKVEYLDIIIYSGEIDPRDRSAKLMAAEVIRETGGPHV